ncbi:MAG TPA: glycosyltransferase family 4 protein [Holophaga sp.]|nr:glycosyltransferase family 4 protein [Holophaga sp.]
MMIRMGDPVKHVVFAHRKLSFGGGERVLIEQVAALAELPVRVSILFNKEPDRRDIEAELRERNPHVETVLHLPGAFGAWRWLRRARPDLLVLCNHKGVQRALPWVGRRIPTVVTLHEHYERHLAKYRAIRRRVDRWIITWAFEDAVRKCLGDQPCSLIHPVYPRQGALPPTAEEKRAARRELGLPEDAFVVGYAGQMDRRKDPAAVIALSESLERALGREIHVLLAGREDRHAQDSLDAALAHSPLAARVRRTGPLPRLAQAFIALDLYAMTSRNEGFFPIALLEAMERGVPIIAPTVGGIRTQLVDGRGGLLIHKPDDRQPIAPALLEDAAQRAAALIRDPEAWATQKALAIEQAASLAKDYDAAALFRDAVAAWIP